MTSDRFIRRQSVEGQMAQLYHFVSAGQRQALWECLTKGEERAYFRGLVAEYAHRVATMPVTYEQAALGENATAHLHYFTGDRDWWITERDTSAQQLRVFGWARCGHEEPEAGYVCVEELCAAGAELDLHWTPKPIAKCLMTRTTGYTLNM